MSVIPWECTFVKKTGCLQDQDNLKLVEANYKGNAQMLAIRDLILDKNREYEKKVRAMGAYMWQHVNDFPNSSTRSHRQQSAQLPLRERINLTRHGTCGSFNSTKALCCGSRRQTDARNVLQ